MSGFNMPPGVSTNDIPGNEPIDAEAEGMAEAVYDALLALPGPGEWTYEDLYGAIRDYLDMREADAIGEAERRAEQD